MARIYIEDKFFSSQELRIFTQIMKRKSKWSGQASKGFLIDFWHDSQVKLVYMCDHETLLKFIAGYDETIGIENVVYLALLEAGFVQKKSDALYIIEGNKKHVERLQWYKDRQKLSVEAKRNSLVESLDTPSHDPCSDGISSLTSSSSSSLSLFSQKSEISSKTEIKKINKKSPSLAKRILIEPNRDSEYFPAIEILLTVPIYAKKFDPTKDDKFLADLRTRYSLTLPDMQNIARDFATWASDLVGKEIKSPRGTLNTFCRNYVEKRKQIPKAQGGNLRESEKQNIEEIKEWMSTNLR